MSKPLHIIILAAGEGTRMKSNRPKMLQSVGGRPMLRRVLENSWEVPTGGDVAMLAGSRSVFTCDDNDPALATRAAEGDLDLALPLWGRGPLKESPPVADDLRESLAAEAHWCRALEAASLSLDYRPARLRPDDFQWQFCDDGVELRFVLGRGAYATSLLRELVAYNDKTRNRSED